MKKQENFKNIKPKLKFSSELEFDEFLNGVAKKFVIDEILTEDEIAELKKQKFDDEENPGKKLF